MSDENNNNNDETKDDAEKTPEIKDLEPEKDPAGGTDHGLPPGQQKKTGGSGGA